VPLLIPFQLYYCYDLDPDQKLYTSLNRYPLQYEEEVQGKEVDVNPHFRTTMETCGKGSKKIVVKS